jgi:hypothetical protein
VPITVDVVHTPQANTILPLQLVASRADKAYKRQYNGQGLCQPDEERAQ